MSREHHSVSLLTFGETGTDDVKLWKRDEQRRGCRLTTTSMSVPSSFEKLDVLSLRARPGAFYRRDQPPVERQ